MQSTYITLTNFYKFLDNLKREESLTRVQILHFLAVHAPPPQRQRYVDRSARILHIVDDYPIAGQSTIYKVQHTTCPPKSTNHVSILLVNLLKFQKVLKVHKKSEKRWRILFSTSKNIQVLRKLTNITQQKNLLSSFPLQKLLQKT